MKYLLKPASAGSTCPHPSIDLATAQNDPKPSANQKTSRYACIPSAAAPKSVFHRDSSFLVPHNQHGDPPSFPSFLSVPRCPCGSFVSFVSFVVNPIFASGNTRLSIDFDRKACRNSLAKMVI
jgi:hypothetical protein